MALQGPLALAPALSSSLSSCLSGNRNGILALGGHRRAQVEEAECVTVMCSPQARSKCLFVCTSLIPLLLHQARARSIPTSSRAGMKPDWSGGLSLGMRQKTIGSIVLCCWPQLAESSPRHSSSHEATHTLTHSLNSLSPLASSRPRFSDAHSR